MTQLIAPPVLWPATALLPTLRDQGFAVLDAAGVSGLSGCPLQDLLALVPFWDDLPPDLFLKDGGRYRRRRHSCFELSGDELRMVPHRAHWQPLAYNALHGGIERDLLDPRPHHHHEDDEDADDVGDDVEERVLACCQVLFLPGSCHRVLRLSSGKEAARALHRREIPDLFFDLAPPRVDAAVGEELFEILAPPHAIGSG